MIIVTLFVSGAIKINITPASKTYLFNTSYNTETQLWTTPVAVLFLAKPYALRNSFVLGSVSLDPSTESKRKPPPQFYRCFIIRIKFFYQPMAQMFEYLWLYLLSALNKGTLGETRKRTGSKNGFYMTYKVIYFQRKAFS